MQIDQFRSALHTMPSKPSTIRTASGESYSVNHPKTVAVSHSGRTVVLLQGEEVAIIDLAGVTEVVLGKPKRTSRKGGEES